MRALRAAALTAKSVPLGAEPSTVPASGAPDADLALPELTVRWPCGAELVARAALPSATLAAIFEAFARGAEPAPGTAAPHA